MLAIEIKRALTAKAEKGFHIALDDRKSKQAILVNSGTGRYRKEASVEAVGVRALVEVLRSLGQAGEAPCDPSGRRGVQNPSQDATAIPQQV